MRLVDPRGEGSAYLIYPLQPHTPVRPDPGAWHSLGKVIGHSRCALLADLGIPRTTTQLAAQHHLSQSTVSYHLAQLHRAGQVTRTRAGNRVYYERRAESEALVLQQGSTLAADVPGRRGDEMGIVSA
ncbi:ArsR/SmtB family transcription factor [Streptomyces sp. 8N706]|uniref:ArsR/SmtB family transcription factor n=1 Tax=Streptomyces sp. 8N706 TaxID=3457416 RepID=UPI003FD50904